MELNKSRKRTRVVPAYVPNGAKPVNLDGPLPTVQWVQVFPETALQWLNECNDNNRSIRDDQVAKFAADMKAGAWMGRNGEPIKFDTNGHMIEGQHRCWACVEANVPFETLMLTQVDPEAYSTSGIGATKRYSDFLVHDKNVHLLAAVAKLVYYWEKQMLGGVTKKTTPSNLQMDATLRAHPKIRESVNKIAGMTETRRLLSASFAGLIHYAGTKEGRAATVDSFLERLGNGLGLMADDPVYQLRRFLLGQRGPTPGTRRARQDYVLALTIKAWNASKAQRSLKLLRFQVDEVFPVL